MPLLPVLLPSVLPGCPASHRDPQLIRRQAPAFTATDTSSLDHRDVRFENGRIAGKVE
jgi:hypothetical protein